MDTSVQFKKQLPLNLAANLISFGLNISIGLFLVPFFIKHLGIERYGFIPLATSLTSYVALMTISLNSAVSRYLTLDIQRNDFNSGNKTFNTSFFTLVAITALLTPAVLVFSYFAPSIFNAPVGSETEIRLLFSLSLLAFLISVIVSTFKVSAFAYNRLDLQKLPQISNLIIRTAIIVFLFLFIRANLAYVGISFLAAALAGGIVSIIIWRKLTPQLRLSPAFFDIDVVKGLSIMSWWVLINQTGAVLFIKTDLIISNLMFGPEEAGRYAAVLQWAFVLRTMAGVFSGLFAPMIMICHAKNDREQLIRIAHKAVKYMGVFVALVVGIICGFSKPILTLWLGPEFAELWPLMWILLIHLSVNLAVLPLFSIGIALNRVKVPALITLFSGLANIALALVLAKYTALGLYSIALAGAVVLTLKNLVFTPIYAAYITNVPRFTFIKQVIVPLILMLIAVFISRLLALQLNPETFSNLFLSISLSCSITASFGWFLFLTKEDRSLIVSIVKRNFT